MLHQAPIIHLLIEACLCQYIPTQQTRRGVETDSSDRQTALRVRNPASRRPSFLPFAIMSLNLPQIALPVALATPL